MNITATPYDGALLVTMNEDRIDAASAIQFKDAMQATIAGAPPRVVIDLSAVKFLDSSGLGAIVAVMKMLAPDRQLELCGLTEHVGKVLRLTRLDQVFTIHQSADDALSGLAHAS